ncbi:MAG: thioredoxin peroxidase [Planctomycetota bacterium]|nr:MAG: thioredoxin peroxidase [Planctomycetota bacterium]
MAFLVSNEAPGFTAQAVMPDNSFKEISLSDYKGKYVVLFFYPLDFTFVCPTEIVAFNKQLDAFKSKNCEVLGVSVDSHFSHLAWKNTTLENGGIGDIQYPLVSDLTKSISTNYGVLFNGIIALRGLFLIDKEGVIQHSVVNNLPLGRNVEEALRMVDALQHTEENGEVCPANWKTGEEAMAPTSESTGAYLAKNS